jgi:hypothetical protein
MIMVSYHSALEPLRSNPRIVFIKRMVWLFVIGVFIWALGGVVSQFTSLIVSEKYAVTLLVVGDNRLGLMHFDPKSQRLFKLILPQKLQLSLNKDQKIEADKLWPYAKAKGDPFKITGTSLINYFGISIDGYVEDREWKDGAFEVSSAWVRSPKTRSSLKLWDRYALIRTISKLESQKVKIEELPVGMYEKKTQPDGYEIYELDSDKFGLYAAEKFAIDALVADRRTIAVINATGNSGQARGFERVLKTVGAGVVEIKEGEGESGQCRVIYSGELDGIVQWLHERYKCSVAEDKNTNRQAEVEIYLEKNWPLAQN